MVPLSELQDRMSRLRYELDRRSPEWTAAIVSRKVSLYYLTGTMPSGSLWIPRDGEAVLFVRRGFERAKEESALPDIRAMRSYRDMVAEVGPMPDSVLIEKDGLTLSHFDLMNKHFAFENTEPLEPALWACRAVKSPYEIERIERSGLIHREVLENELPDLLEVGMSEADLARRLSNALLEHGAHGVVRVNQFDTELLLGYVCFGENSLVSTNFDGPDGVRGLSPAVPYLGDPNRRLREGDLIFADVVCGFEGYHTDKTVVLQFGGSMSDVARDSLFKCVDIQYEAAEQLRPGRKPSEIYESILSGLDPDFLENFMGYGSQQVRFLGHGVGLHIDEPPAIAGRFDEPLQENMVIALEPKRGIPGVGLVGIENTFIVTENGGRCVTSRGEEE